MDEKSVRRFWVKVDKCGPVPAHRPELGPCWVWLAGKSDNRYGLFWTGLRNEKAHRVAWELANGPISDDRRVLHRCDNPLCTRHDHLFLGTQAENLADMAAKGRAARQDGERNGRAVLDEADVRLMRGLRKRGLKMSVLGRMFGVNQATVNLVCSRKTWRCVA